VNGGEISTLGRRLKRLPINMPISSVASRASTRSSSIHAQSWLALWTGNETNPNRPCAETSCETLVAWTRNVREGNRPARASSERESRNRHCVVARLGSHRHRRHSLELPNLLRSSVQDACRAGAGGVELRSCGVSFLGFSGGSTSLRALSTRLNESSGKACACSSASPARERSCDSEGWRVDGLARTL
jgi:hypothetical protein